MNDALPPVEDQFATISTRTGEITLAYQSFGDEEDPVFLLVTGWCSDVTLWPWGFCAELAGRGYRVIRYDNRDTGLSTRTDIDTLDPADPPYTMSDLAADAIGLLDALGITKAHVSGFAYGGTVSHLIAIEHPDRVLSLTPMATASGARTDAAGNPLTAPDPSIFDVLGKPFPADPEERGRYHKKAFSAMAGSSFDEGDYDRRRQESEARGAEIARGDIQNIAGAAATISDRTEQLGQLTIPALVVHSENDPLVSMEAAQVHTDAFQDGKLLVLEGIGHGVLPERHWAVLADAMHEVALRAKG